MSEETIVTVTSIFWLAIFAILFFPTGCAKSIAEYETAIANCEKELPRNQHCEITAKIKGANEHE